MIENEAYFNPFPGLRAFEEEEEYLFFGREKQIDDLLNKLGRTHFLAVIGTSGSGKSSLVKSGLLPSLHSGFIKGVGKGWRIGVFRPGDDPIGNLAACFCGEELIEGEEGDFTLQPIIESILRRSDEGIINVVEQFLNEIPENILLVADQFEELFRFSKYEKTSHKGTRDSVVFINLLLAAIKDRQKKVYIVFTMRSDFLGNCTEFRGLPEAINEGQYLIPRMTREEIKLAITGPIAVSGAEISPQLVTMFLNEVGDNPDQLPILQHALMRTCDYWSKNTNQQTPITIQHYEAIGKMELALSNHADEAYFELTEEQKSLCPHLFKALTEVGTTSGGVRRPTKLSELCALLKVEKEAIIPIIDVFRQRGRSFLMPPIDVPLKEDTVIDISHESLMRVWIRLVKWFKEESDSVEIYLGLCQAAALYKLDKIGLYGDPELQLALKWEKNQQPSALWASRYNESFEDAIDYLRKSEEHFYFELKKAEAARKKKRKRAILFMLFLLFCLLISLGLAYWAIWEKGIADEAKKEAERATKVAEDANTFAEIAKRAAIASADTATLAAKKAKEQEKIALQEKERANQQAIKAERERKRANNLKENAENIAKIAEALKDSAEISKENAVRSEAKAKQLKNIADARYKAVVAIKKLNNQNIEEGIELAVEAHQQYTENQGNKRDGVIYEALSKSLNESGKAILSIDNNYGVKQLAVHPNQNLLASVNENDELIFNELVNNRLNEIPSMELSEAHLVEFSSDGNYLIVQNKSHNISLYSLGLSKALTTPLSQFQFTKQVQQIKRLANNRFVFLDSSGVRFFQVNGDNLQELIQQKVTANRIDQIALHQNQQTLAYSAANELTIKQIDSEQKIVLTIQCNSKITALEFCNQDNLLAIGLASGGVRLLSLSDQFAVESDLTFSNHNSAVTKVQFIENAKEVLMLSASFDNTVGIININDVFQEVKDARKGVKLKGHNLWVNDLVISHNQQYFFTASEDKTVRFWYVDPNEIVNILTETPSE